MPQKSAERFILEVVGLDGAELDADKDLLLSGILDSLTLIRLVHHLENQFDVKIPYADIHPANFGTLRSIGEYFDRLLTEKE